MTRPLLIENARIVDPASGTDGQGAVLVENGIITEVALGAPVGVPDGAEVVNAKGLVLAPGLIDMRVFTGEPGKEYRDTLQSAGDAAAAGGVTSFVMMPDTVPVVDDGALVHQWKLSTSDLVTRFQPSTRTNSRILNGREMKTGGSITMPIDMSVELTTMSMTRNGRKIRKPI